MLTKKQHQLLLFIDAKLRDGGVSPSFDEMKEALSLKSKSGIHRLITGLEERGFIRRLPHRARALEVLKLPEGVVPPRFDRSAGQVADFDRHSRAARASAPPPVAMDSMAMLPLYGRIAAGTPIEAFRDTSVTVAVPPDMVGPGDHYTLEVAGDSMVDAGILDGDVAVIRRADTAETGEIVVALVDELEVTLKRLRKRGHTLALEAANPAYETRIFGPDRVRVQGRLVGLMRRYS